MNSVIIIVFPDYILWTGLWQAEQKDDAEAEARSKGEEKTRFCKAAKME